MKFKVKPKRITKLSYFCLLLISIVLVIIYWMSAFYDVVVINAEVNSHISNFAMSLICYLGIGYTWILQKNNFKKIALLGLFISAANLLCETVMGFINTVDIVDAVYGIVGTSIVFCYLFIVKKHGLEIIYDEGETQCE